ncbi:MAG: hypothetical protein WBF90_13395 [Rivularia sp. (in: cyanobacteria)]
MYLALVTENDFRISIYISDKITYRELMQDNKRQFPNKLSTKGVNMNKLIKRTFLPSLLATGIFSATLMPAQPAAADDLLEDAAIGAAAGAITGIITNNDSVLTNAVNGAAAGAAVNAANSGRRKRSRNILQDVGAGAAGGTVAGEITNRDNTVSNTINGAAAGAAIHIIKGK